MTALVLQPIVDAGTKPTFVAATASDTAAIGNGSQNFLVYRNTSASPVTVTLTVPGNNSYGQPNPDPAIVVAATTGEAWVPLRKVFDDGTGTVTMTCTPAAGFTVALVSTNWS